LGFSAAAAVLVGAADDRSAFDAATGKPDAEPLVVVIAAVHALRNRQTAATVQVPGRTVRGEALLTRP
jgi:hypothetical protein